MYFLGNCNGLNDSEGNCSNNQLKEWNFNRSEMQLVLNYKSELTITIQGGGFQLEIASTINFTSHFIKEILNLNQEVTLS